jgi:hypothetical protein
LTITTDPPPGLAASDGVSSRVSRMTASTLVSNAVLIAASDVSASGVIGGIANALCTTVSTRP